MSVEQFMKNLYAISEKDGVPFGRTRLIYEAEETHEREMMKFAGYLALSDGFKCFYLETVALINTVCRPNFPASTPETYIWFVPRLCQSFTALCGSERIALRGYPYQGYTLLRNIFDNLVLTSATVQGITNTQDVEGIVAGQTPTPEGVKRLRKDTEFEVRRQMLGSKSGLSSEVVEQLGLLDMLYDFETHGARLSATHTMEWMKGDSPLPILPAYVERSAAMFINRYCETAWLLHRLIPLFQFANAPLPDDWKRKWQILDDSFIATARAMTEQVGKPVGAAFAKFVTVKFPFDSMSSFPP